MARIVPDGWQTMDAIGAMRREFETLESLAQGLPDEYTVYHAVHWTNIERSHAIHGEVDFVIVNQSRTHDAHRAEMRTIGRDA